MVPNPMPASVAEDEGAWTYGKKKGHGGVHCDWHDFVFCGPQCVENHSERLEPSVTSEPVRLYMLSKTRKARNMFLLQAQVLRRDVEKGSS